MSVGGVVKSFQMFTVSEELLQKVVEAVQAGDKKARSSGDIQSFEVFCHGFRQNIALGRIYIVPPAICNDRKNFPTALLYGAIVRIFGTGGEEVADLIEHKMGVGEFDEYSQADFDTIKEQLFVDPQTEKEACLVLFAPNWMNTREFISFHFTKDSDKLKNNLRHQVFSAYYAPYVSSAFNALMTNVNTTKVDVTDITPKLSMPFLAGSLLREYPVLVKQAGKQKPTVLLNSKTADAIEKESLDPQELNVFEALDTALENSLQPDTRDAEAVGDGGYQAPMEGGVPRAASKNAHMGADGKCLGCKESAEKCACKDCGCKQAAANETGPICTCGHMYDEHKKGKCNKCEHCKGYKKNASASEDVNPLAAHETPITNVGPGAGAAAKQKDIVPAMKESLEEVKKTDEKATDPIGIKLDEEGRPIHKGDEKTAAETPVKVGDKVRYAVKWLRSTSQYTGPIANAKGVVTELQPFGDNALAVIDWGGEDLPTKVLTSNLTVVGSSKERFESVASAKKAWQGKYDQSGMFKQLSPEEEQQFRAYAEKTDPPDMAKWDIYHPVCREVWEARGITPHDDQQQSLGMPPEGEKLSAAPDQDDYESRVQALEAEGLTRSDAQSVVDAEDQRGTDKVSSKKTAMNSFKVTFEDGNSLTTGFNGTLQDAESYYLNNDFQFGDTDEHPADKLVRGVKVEQVGSPETEQKKFTPNASKKKAKPANNQTTRKHDLAHPETLRVGQERLSSAYSAAYNGGFVDKHDMPPQTVRDYLTAHMGNNAEYAPHALADHQKQIEAGAFGEDAFNRRAQEKWGKVTAAQVKADFVADHIAADFDKGYEVASPKTKKANLAREAHLDKFRSKEAVSLDIDSIWDEITEDMGPAPLIDVDSSAPSNPEPNSGGEEPTEERTGRPNKRDVGSLPEAMRSDEPEDKKALSDNEAESQEDSMPHADESSTKESAWRVDSKLADFVGEIYDDVNDDEVPEGKQRVWCNQCEMLSINGVPCHEGGCPNEHKVWDPNALPLYQTSRPDREYGEWVNEEQDMAEDDEVMFDNYEEEPEEEHEASEVDAAGAKYVGDNNPAMMASTKTADTADNENDIDAAGQPSTKELGESSTVGDHKKYDTQQSKGAARKRADTADNPANEADGEGAILVKTNKEITNTRGKELPTENAIGGRSASKKKADTVDNPANEKGGEGALTDKSNASNTRGKELPKADPIGGKTAAASETLLKKLHPKRFPGMSGKMAAIVGYLLGKNFTDPAITEMAITSDGMVLAQQAGDVGMNDMIGSVDDLKHNWEQLLGLAGLDDKERQEAEGLFKKLRSYQRNASWLRGKTADTADNPFNMAGGEGAPENKKNVQKKDTSGPTPDNTKQASVRKAASILDDAFAFFIEGKKDSPIADAFNETYKRTGRGDDIYMAVSRTMMDYETAFQRQEDGTLSDIDDYRADAEEALRAIVGDDPNYSDDSGSGMHQASVEEDIAQAKSECDSPDSIDGDISQPTVSVAEAGKFHLSGGKVALHFMNQWDVEEAAQRYAKHPVLGKATRFLKEFMEEVNQHSDGWAYWKAPVAAAGQLMTLIEAGRADRNSPTGESQITEQAFRKALAPIKSFMTRRGLAAGMQMPQIGEAAPQSMDFDKEGADISGDMSQAKSELDYNKAEMADSSEATDTVNPDHFAAKKADLRDEFEDREDPHGYYHWKCRDCGESGWTDTTPDCNCRRAEENPEPEEGQFRCDNCGEIFADAEKHQSDDSVYCSKCIGEFEDPASLSSLEGEVPPIMSSKTALGPCMCGDTNCPSCGSAQGTWPPPVCAIDGKSAEDCMEHFDEEGNVLPEFEEEMKAAEEAWAASQSEADQGLAESLREDSRLAEEYWAEDRKKQGSSGAMINNDAGGSNPCGLCGQPIRQGELVLYGSGGAEQHQDCQGAAARAQQPPQTPAQRIQQMPQRGNPKSPRQLGLQTREKEQEFDFTSSKEAAGRVALKCNECGKRFSVSPNAADPQCPKCHGVDWEVDDTKSASAGDDMSESVKFDFGSGDLADIVLTEDSDESK